MAKKKPTKSTRSTSKKSRAKKTTGRKTASGGKGKTISLAKARAAKEKALARFNEIAGVSGVGITRKDGQYAVRINLEQELDEGVKLPARIEGVAVVVKVTGPIRKQKTARRGKVDRGTTNRG